MSFKFLLYLEGAIKPLPLNIKTTNMKKIILLTAAVLFVAFSAQAQPQDLSYKKGDNLFNAGLGLGYYGYGLGIGRSSSIPALEANFELGIHEYFGVGPYAGIVRWNYRYSGFDGGFSILTFGGRGSFHYKDLLEELLDSEIGSEKLDLYVTLLFGLEIESYSGDFTTIRNNGVGVFIGPVLGARYYFTNNFVLTLKAEEVLQLLKAGITVRIKSKHHPSLIAKGSVFFYNRKTTGIFVGGFV